jgi:hypothetical protein
MRDNNSSNSRALYRSLYYLVNTPLLLSDKGGGFANLISEKK